MNRRVLIVSPHFPPVNAADHQRVRMAFPYLNEFGWSAEVVAVEPKAVEGANLDPLLEDTVPSEVPVHRVSAVPARFTRKIGLGNLALRALPFLGRMGSSLLRRGSKGQRFDLVYFSTTQFPVMILGPIWKRRFGIPYAVDFQDPWVDDYYERTGTQPPGGRFRRRLDSLLANQLEPRVMRNVSEVTVVSPDYREALKTRYSYLTDDQFTVLPFGAPQRDFEMLSEMQVRDVAFDSTDGKRHWAYVGAVGPIMAPSLRLLFEGLRRSRQAAPTRWANVILHFVGTSYAPAGKGVETVRPIAREFGVADMVEEKTDRIGYFEALRTISDADALLVLGSDSPSYTASKLYPYILARRPMLSVLHEQSPAVEIVRKCRAGELVTFDPANLEASNEQMRRALLRLRVQSAKVEREKLKVESSGEQSAIQTDWEEFKQYSAREMTRRMCAVFDRAVEGVN